MNQKSMVQVCVETYIIYYSNILIFIASFEMDNFEI